MSISYPGFSSAIVVHPRSTVVSFGGFTMRNSLGREMKKILDSGMVRQSATYFIAQAINALLGIVVYGILTRALSVEAFGSYALLMAILTFGSLIFDFGVSSSGMRLMALAKDRDDQRSRLGAVFVVALLIGGAFCIATALASFVAGSVFDERLASLLLVVSPFVFALPIIELLLTTSQGANRIGLLSLYTVLPRTVLIVLLTVLVSTGELTIVTAIIGTMCASLVTVLYAVVSQRPKFRGIDVELKLLAREVKEFGKEMYRGRIIDGLTNWADRMLISLHHGMASLGFYSIASTMLSPLNMVSQSISASSYYRFARENRISPFVFLANGVASIAGSVILLFACSWLIPLFFTEKYSDALALLPFLAAGVALNGLNQPFHAFLSAQRQGRSIRVISISTSSLNVILNIILIPKYAAIGAAMAYTSSYAVNIIMNLHYYSRFRLREKTL